MIDKKTADELNRVLHYMAKHPVSPCCNGPSVEILVGRAWFDVTPEGMQGPPAQLSGVFKCRVCNRFFDPTFSEEL